MQNDVYSEGLHFRVPWFQCPIIYDVRPKGRRIPSATAWTKDLQMVNTTVKMRTRPDVRYLPQIDSKLGKNCVEWILPTICNEV